MLTEAHISVIEKDVVHARIFYSHLKEDLVDHICCDVESEMEQGYKFNDAYKMVQQRIGYRGLKKIQDDTFYLIDKTYRIMKNTMKATGLIAPVLMGFGSLFKVFHWPGASVLLVLGFLTLCLVFLPTSVYVLYKETRSNKNVLTYLTGFIAAFAFALGVLFKVQHWPASGILLVVGEFMLIVLFLPALLAQSIRNVSDRLHKVSIIIAFFAAGILAAGYLFKLMHWPGAAMFLVVGNVFLFLIAVPLYGTHILKSKTYITGRFIMLMLGVAWLVLSVNLISVKVSRNLSQSYNGQFSELLHGNKLLKESNSLFLEKSQFSDATKAQKLHAGTASVLETIDGLKSDLVMFDSGVRPEAGLNSKPFLHYLKTPFGHDLVRQYMLDKDAGSGEGYALQDELKQYLREMDALLPAHDLNPILEEFYNDVAEDTWPSHHFSNSLAYTLEYLTLLQQKLLMLESAYQSVILDIDAHAVAEDVSPQKQSS